jgi:hypothetical protein
MKEGSAPQVRLTLSPRLRTLWRHVTMGRNGGTHIQQTSYNVTVFKYVTEITTLLTWLRMRVAIFFSFLSDTSIHSVSLLIKTKRANADESGRARNAQTFCHIPVLTAYTVSTFQLFNSNFPYSFFFLFLVGWNWVSWYCGHYWPIVPAPDDRWWWLWRNWWNIDWQGKPKYSEKTCPMPLCSVATVFNSYNLPN